MTYFGTHPLNWLMLCMQALHGLFFWRVSLITHAVKCEVVQVVAGVIMYVKWTLCVILAMWNSWAVTTNHLFEKFHTTYWLVFTLHIGSFSSILFHIYYVMWNFPQCYPSQFNFLRIYDVFHMKPLLIIEPWYCWIWFTYFHFLCHLSLCSSLSLKFNVVVFTYITWLPLCGMPHKYG